MQCMGVTAHRVWWHRAPLRFNTTVYTCHAITAFVIDGGAACLIIGTVVDGIAPHVDTPNIHYMLANLIGDIWIGDTILVLSCGLCHAFHFDQSITAANALGIPVDTRMTNVYTVIV